MKTVLSRVLHKVLPVFLCLLALGLVFACTVYSAHAVEGETHCDCPICRIFTAIGAVFALSFVSVVLVAVKRGVGRHTSHAAPALTPVRLAVKLNC
jgi:hypothetical protein